MSKRSPEHLAAMAAGRARKALERKQAADARALPAGAQRDELRAINKDHLEQEMEARVNKQGIEGIDRSKLERKDNEIQRHIRRRDKSSGIPVKGMEPGYRYAFLTNSMNHGSQAQANIRQQLSDAKSVGYVPVQGKDPAGAEYEGGDGVSGTTLRGVGDVFLHKIREEDYQATLAEDREKAQRQGIIEDRAVVYARERLGMNVMHNIADPTDNFVQQRERNVGAGSLRSETITVGINPGVMVNSSPATEGDFRRGSLKMPNGQTYTPEMAARAYGRRV